MTTKDREDAALRDHIAALETEVTRLRQQQSALKHIVSSIPYFVFWKDAAGRYLGCNEQFARVAGVAEPDMIVGKDDYDMPWSKEEAEFYRDVDRRVMAGGTIQETEETQIDAAGKQRVVFTSKVPLRDATGEVSGILGIYTDITARKQLELDLKTAKENAEAASQAKSDFLAAVSHELRTPLALVLGPLEMLLARTDVPVEVHDTLESIQRNGWRLKNLMDDVLDISKSDAGMNVVFRERTDVRAIIARIVDEAMPAAAAPGLTLTTELDDVGSFPVDRRLFERMTLNYIGNALKFTPAGGRVTVKLEGSGPSIRLVVTDNGIGIAEDKQAKLFSRFFQADASMTRRFGGTGLGLALVKEYAELMGGTVAVQSTLGAGSAFSFTLPRTEMATADDASNAFTPVHDSAALAARFDPEATRTRSSSPPSPSNGDAPTVVLAEDNAELRAHIAKVLAGYRVISCANGALALDAVRTHRPDVLVTDVMMPELNGQQLIAAVKGDPAIADTPVIVLTAFADRGRVASTLDGGADDFLEKPFTPSELAARVGVAVRLRAARKELVAKNAELVLTMGRVVEMEKLAALGRMLTQIAHEINNPMVAVVGNIEPLTEYLQAAMTMIDEYAAAPALAGVEGEALRRRAVELDIDFIKSDVFVCLDCVREGVERVRSIQKDLRSFLRGTAEEQSDEVDVNEGLKATVDMLRRALPPGIRVDLQLGELPRLPVKMGPLKQVFLNVLQNAADALGAVGTIAVTTALRGDAITISVTDDGVGIPPSLRSRVFEPFFTTKDVGKGSGLGLAVCRQILNQHGGEIRLDNSAAGTRFVIDLPVARKEDAA